VIGESPKFVPSISHVIYVNPPGKPPEIFLNAMILNQGAPSIAYGYRLTVADASGKKTVLLPVDIPKDIRSQSEAGQKFLNALKIGPETDLFGRTVTPIERGGMRRGWIRYIAEGMSADQVRHANLELSIRDFLEHEAKAPASQECATEMRMPTAEEEVTLYCPGL
jgi:hypothetical protein